MSDLRIPSCPTCGGSGRIIQQISTQIRDSGIIWLDCPDCNRSGYHPDTIEHLAEVLWRQFIAVWDDLTAEHTRWDENPKIHDRWRVRAIAVLDALTGDSE